jgi:hypothetical protein
LCPWCGAKTAIPEGGFVWNPRPDTTLSSAAGLVKQLAEWDIDYARGDVLVAGLTVVGGYGWAPPAGTRVTVAVCADHLAVIQIAHPSSVIELSYERIHDFDFEGGATSKGGGFIGGGFGVIGAASGMIVASVLNSLTARTSINSLVRISASDGEVYLHRGGLYPQQLRTVFGPAVNAVHGRHTTNEPRQLDPIERLEKLGQLREAGTLTQEEFDAAKAKILGELT